MKKTIVAAAAFLAASGVACAQNAILKAGLWEVKVLRQVMDGRDMSGEMAAAQEQARQAMANMTPEQRKQMESMMGGRGLPSFGSDGAMRICISPAMAARESVVADPQERCPPARTSRSGNQVSFEFNCSANGRTTQGRGIATLGDGSVQTSVDATMGDPQGQHTMHTEAHMSYVGPDCQGIKPADELGKGAGPAH